MRLAHRHAAAAAPQLSRRPRRNVVTAAAAVATQPAATAAADAIPRGETAGAVLVLEDVTLQVGERDLLTGAEWRLMPGHRAGLVGANGAGKSTLLRALAGQRPVQGRIAVAPRVEVGYLEQTAVSGSELSVWDEARSQMKAILRAEDEMTSAAAAMADGDARAADRLSQAQADFEAAGGYDADKRVGSVLSGLGFAPEQWHRSCAEFSGGWQMRIALARLLLSDAGQAASRGGGGGSGGGGAGGGLLLLDEPTNHLDSAAVKWLANFLATSGGTLVLVSHDEALLEGACDRIVEVRGRALHHYTGSYSRFLELREERAASAAAAAAASQAEIERLEGFVARFGAKASKASQAQSRQKQLERLRAAAPDAPVAASGAGPGDARKVALALPPPPPCYTEVLRLEGVAAGWPASPFSTASSDDESGAAAAPPPAPVVSNVNALIEKGMRVLVLGPNGAGKSTLLRTMAGTLAPAAGRVARGEGVRVGVFSQDLAQELPLDRPALDYVCERAREADTSITLEKCRQALGALGLTGGMALQTIGSLSGGEKARVALAVFALIPSNLLLLDEASNHLDAATIDVLTGALSKWPGTIIAITHNRSFAESLNATHVLRVKDGTATLSSNLGLTAADFDHGGGGGTSSGGSQAGGSSSSKGGKAAKSNDKKKQQQQQSQPKASSSSNGTGSSNGSAAPAARAAAARKRTTLSFKEREEYERLQREMAAASARQTDLESRVEKLAAAGAGARADLEAASAELAALAAKSEEMEFRWLELAELAGDL